jgi:hypothetical protein
MHSQQAKAVPRMRPGVRVVDVKSGSIIANNEFKPMLAKVELDVHCARAGIPRDVSQRLLRDPKTGRLQLRLQAQWPLPASHREAS